MPSIFDDAPKEIVPIVWNFQRAFRAVILFTVLSCAARSSLAQDCCPRGETFAGHSFLSADAKTDRIVSPQFDSRYVMSRSGYGVPLNGFNQAVNLSKRLALLFDFSHNAKELIINNLALGQASVAAAETRINANLFLVGARLNNRGEGSNFFGEAMIGGFNRRVEAKDATLGNLVKVSNTDLALALGGGADVAIAKDIGYSRLITFSRGAPQIHRREKIG
jgi:hypothetical protein